jgi:hypothetical protein
MTLNEVTFWEGWSGHGRSPGLALSQDQARLRHYGLNTSADVPVVIRNDYIALIGPPAKPTAYVQYALNRKYCSVNFLDEVLRIFDCCSFREGLDGRYFMSQTEFFAFEGDTKKRSYSQLMMLKPTGEVIVEESFYTRGTKRDGKGKFDLKDFYIDPPQFGDVAPFLKFGKDGAFRPKLSGPSMA